MRRPVQWRLTVSYFGLARRSAPRSMRFAVALHHSAALCSNARATMRDTPTLRCSSIPPYKNTRTPKHRQQFTLAGPDGLRQEGMNSVVPARAVVGTMSHAQVNSHEEGPITRRLTWIVCVAAGGRVVRSSYRRIGPLRVLWRPIGLGWIGYRGRRVITPDAAEVQVRRIRAR